MSLVVPPNTPATRRMSARGRSAKATRRWDEMAPLIDVWGAWNGAGGSVPSASRFREAIVRAVCTVRAMVRATAST